MQFHLPLLLSCPQGTKNYVPRTNVPLERNLAGCNEIVTSTDHITSTYQLMEFTKNQAYMVTPIIPVEPNQCYVTTTPSLDDQLYATVEGEYQLCDAVEGEYQLCAAVEGEYQLYAAVEGEYQQQDMKLTVNQAYAATSNIIPVEPNQCYGLNTI